MKLDGGQFMIGYDIELIHPEDITEAVYKAKHYTRFKDIFLETKDAIHSIPRRFTDLETTKELEMYIGAANDFTIFDRIKSHYSNPKRGHPYFMVLGRVDISNAQDFEKHAIRLFNRIKDSGHICISNKSEIGYSKLECKGAKLNTAIFYLTFKGLKNVNDNRIRKIPAIIKEKIIEESKLQRPDSISSQEIRLAIENIDNRQKYGQFEWHFRALSDEKTENDAA